MALMVKNLLANAREVKDTDQSLGQEDPLEEEMSTHPSILAWRIPWTEEPDGLQSIVLQSWTWLKQLSMWQSKTEITYQMAILPALFIYVIFSDYI